MLATPDMEKVYKADGKETSYDKHVEGPGPAGDTRLTTTKYLQIEEDE